MSEPVFEAYVKMVENQMRLDLFDTQDKHAELKHGLSMIGHEDHNQTAGRWAEGTKHPLLSKYDFHSELHDALGGNNYWGKWDKPGDKSVHAIAKDHPNHFVRARAVYSRFTNEEDLRKFATDPHPAVRVAAAKHAHLPADVAENLAKDPHEMVRAEVTGNKNLSLGTLKQMRHDESRHVSDEAVDSHRYRVHPSWDGEHDYGGYFDDEEEHELKGTEVGKRIEATAC